MRRNTTEKCAICGCRLHRDGDYAKPTVKGRSHATKHHYVAERFFGRSANRPGTQRRPIFESCPWGMMGRTVVFCYECHEELLHNPILLPEDIARFAELVKLCGLSEKAKTGGRDKIRGRIQLLHKVIATGLRAAFAREVKVREDMSSHGGRRD